MNTIIGGCALEKEYLLDRSGVDELSMELDRWVKDAGVSGGNAIRIRLTMEELLLRIRDHYDETISGTLLIKKVFGKPVLRFRYRGESYDPIHPDENEIDEYLRMAMERIGMAPEWSYHNGTNELKLKGPGETKKADTWLIGAVILAILVGASGAIVPSSGQEVMLKIFFEPISETFMNALNTFVGIMVFLSIVSGICSIRSMEELSSTGKYVFSKFFRRTFAGAAMGALVLFPFFHLSYGSVVGGQTQIDDIVNMLFSIIPPNPVTPFVDGNMLQIIFMAVMTGGALLVLQENSRMLQKLIQQMLEVIMEVVGAVCKLLPLYIFTSLTIFLWEHGPRELARLWKPILLVAIANGLFLLSRLVYTSVRFKIPVKKLFSKIKKNVITGLLTASSTAVFGQSLEVNEQDLGIAPEFSLFVQPFANIIEAPASVTAMIAIIYYLAGMYNIPVDFKWLVTVWFMTTILTIAAPPVSGGMLVCIGMIMAQLSIPKEGLAIAGILAILFDFMTTGVKVGRIHLELISDADRLGKLNMDILKQ